MSAKQRFLRDESGAVFAEWVVITAVVLTVCMVALTAWRGGGGYGGRSCRDGDIWRLKRVWF